MVVVLGNENAALGSGKRPLVEVNMGLSTRRHLRDSRLSQLQRVLFGLCLDQRSGVIATLCKGSWKSPG